MNPFYNALGGMQNVGGLMQQYQQFRQSMTGDPQQIIQQMMQSGKINQQQLANAQQMARQMGFLK